LESDPELILDTGRSYKCRHTATAAGLRVEESYSGVSKAYKGIYAPKIAVRRTSKGQLTTSATTGKYVHLNLCPKMKS